MNGYAYSTYGVDAVYKVRCAQNQHIRPILSKRKKQYQC